MVRASHLASQSSIPLNTHTLPVFLSSTSVFKKIPLIFHILWCFLKIYLVSLFLLPWIWWTLAWYPPSLKPFTLMEVVFPPHLSEHHSHIQDHILFSVLTTLASCCKLKYLAQGWNTFFCLFKTNRGSFFSSESRAAQIDDLRQSISRLLSLACVTEI